MSRKLVREPVTAGDDCLGSVMPSMRFGDIIAPAPGHGRAMSQTDAPQAEVLRRFGNYFSEPD